MQPDMNHNAMTDAGEASKSVVLRACREEKNVAVQNADKAGNTAAGGILTYRCTYARASAAGARQPCSPEARLSAHRDLSQRREVVSAQTTSDGPPVPVFLAIGLHLRCTPRLDSTPFTRSPRLGATLVSHAFSTCWTIRGMLAPPINHATGRVEVTGLKKRGVASALVPRSKTRHSDICFRGSNPGSSNDDCM